MKRILSTAALAAALGIGALAVTAGAASARIVCNTNGDCWHTDARVTVYHGVRLEAHPDDWYFHQKWEQNQQRHWRDYHEGRGYYENGVWVSRDHDHGDRDRDHGDRH